MLLITLDIRSKCKVEQIFHVKSQWDDFEEISVMFMVKPGKTIVKDGSGSSRSDDTYR